MTPDPEWTVYIEEPQFVRAGLWRGRWTFHGRTGHFIARRCPGGWIAGVEDNDGSSQGPTKHAAIAAWETRVIDHPCVDAIVWRRSSEFAA